MKEKCNVEKKRLTSHKRLPEYAEWLRTERQKGPANLAWYISPILNMQETGITDEDIAGCTDIDQLLKRFCHVDSVWDVGSGKRRAYLRNIIRMYRIFLNSRSMHSAEAKMEDVRFQSAE